MKLKINELAKVLGITTMTLRRYEKKGYLTPERDGADYRWFDDIDIVRMVQIRLLRKCGFSHSDISGFMENTTEHIREISARRLEELDEEMRRLKFLRHWLKDNIQLLDRINELGDGFSQRECPPVRYVIYGTNHEIYKEKERIKTINDFLYTIEEVQPMLVIKKDRFFTPAPTLHRGLAVKEQDIERLGIQEIMEKDSFIQVYPKQTCVYGIMGCDKTDESRHNAHIDFCKRLDKYLKENNYTVNGDIMAFILGVLGEQEHYMMCVPVK